MPVVVCSLPLDSVRAPSPIVYDDRDILSYEKNKSRSRRCVVGCVVASLLLESKKCGGITIYFEDVMWETGVLGRVKAILDLFVLVLICTTCQSRRQTAVSSIFLSNMSCQRNDSRLSTLDPREHPPSTPQKVSINSPQLE